MPPSVLEYVPIALVAAGMIIWGIRLEGRVNISDDRHVQFLTMLEKHYATKNEVSILKGSIDTMGPQLADTKNAVLRIENKVDAFLVAALQHQIPPKS